MYVVNEISDRCFEGLLSLLDMYNMFHHTYNFLFIYDNESVRPGRHFC